MKSDRVQELYDAQLIERFTDLARQAGAAVLDSNVHEANSALRGVWAIEHELKARGREARLQLAPLLDSGDRFVRYYAAQALLGLLPDRARAVIEWNASYGFDAIAGDAKGLLRAFDTGEFKPD